MTSATGPSMSDPATSTDRTAVISPCPSAPGPARSLSAMIICAIEAGNPDGPKGSPTAAATSACASAKRVIESAKSRTCAPASRKNSATVIIVHPQRARSSAGRSEVAATITARAAPQAVRTSVANSRTSRPRSPIRPMTTTSAGMPVASDAISRDLPTPDPAKSPIRCPRTRGRKVSKTASPVSSRGPRARRAVADGGSATSGRGQPPAISGRPSSGAPSGSITRPSQDGSGAMTGGPTWRTGAPSRTPSRLPSGNTTRPVGPIRNTSPVTRSDRRTRSPRETASSSPPTSTA